MKKLFFLTLFAFVLSACLDTIGEFNIDNKNPESVPASYLVSNATINLFKFMALPKYWQNNFRVHARHWAKTFISEYPVLDIATASEKTFSTMYTEVLRDIDEARVFIDDDTFLTGSERASQHAILDVLEVFVYSFLVDLYGDIPYSEALTEELTPKYDDAEEIYNLIIEKLDRAISALNTQSNLQGDLVYDGDSDAWRKFANSLKLKLAIRIADVNDGKARAMAESAVLNGVFISSEDNYKLDFESSPPNTNPLWEQLIQSKRSDYICARTFAKSLNALNDPRIPYFFKNNADDGSAIGGVSGAANSYPSNSQPGILQEDPTFPGVIMSYSEVLFLLADGAERGYNVGGNAPDFYHQAVTNSIIDWGGSNEDAITYIAQTDVNYNTAPGTWKQKIAMQKWIALYDIGFEAWTTYRLYDWPELPFDAATLVPVIKRYTYPITELSLNKENVEAAILKMGGNDDCSNKVFWDVN